MDDIDWMLIEALQRDARSSYRELGDLVGLSAPAVADRMRRLERTGVIVGYRAQIDPAALGLSLFAIIRVTARGRDTSQRIAAWAGEQPNIVECVRVTGSESLVLRAVVATTGDLEAILDEVSGEFDADTLTHVVTSMPVPWSGITRHVTGGTRDRAG